MEVAVGGGGRGRDRGGNVDEGPASRICIKTVLVPGFGHKEDLWRSASSCHKDR